MSLRSLYGDGWSAKPTNQREFQVLAALAELGDKGEAGTIYKATKSWAPELDIADVFITLERLVKRELLTRTEETYQATEDGSRALRRAHKEGKQLATASKEISQDASTETAR